MRIFLYFLILSLLLIACSAKDENVSSNKLYADSHGTWLELDSSRWSTKKTGNPSNFTVFVNLLFSGTTNADSMKILTHGDGFFVNETLEMRANGAFLQDAVNVSFTFFSNTSYTGIIESDTYIYAFKGNDTLITYLSSGKLDY